MRHLRIRRTTTTTTTIYIVHALQKMKVNIVLALFLVDELK